jgi:hypothetical protein
MPSRDTLSIKPIYEWADKYLIESKTSVDPFAKDCTVAQITNDLNPNTKAMFHMKADEFLSQQNQFDLVIFDPPYSLRQIKECYNGVGIGFTHKDSQNCVRWTIERDIISSKQKAGDIVLSFGWTSTCMGKKRGYTIDSILLCSHGPAHNDTICVAEYKCD